MSPGSFTQQSQLNSKTSKRSLGGYENYAQDATFKNNSASVSSYSDIYARPYAKYLEEFQRLIRSDFVVSPELK